MKKKQYMTPATEACKLECVSMLAGSSLLGIKPDIPANGSDALSNKDVWSDGLW